MVIVCVVGFVCALLVGFISMVDDSFDKFFVGPMFIAFAMIFLGAAISQAKDQKLISEAIEAGAIQYSSNTGELVVVDKRGEK